VRGSDILTNPIKREKGFETYVLATIVRVKAFYL
jgi:hypothetical protein